MDDRLEAMYRRFTWRILSNYVTPWEFERLRGQITDYEQWCARRGGTVALLGLAGGATAELPIDLVTLDELDVLGIRSSPNAYPAMIALLASGTIRTEPLTTHVYPLSDVATAFDALARREAIRPIISL